MNRRTVLVATALGVSPSVAGCLSDADDPDTTPTPTDTEPTDPTSDSTPTEDDHEECDPSHQADEEPESAQDGFPELTVEDDEIPEDHESGLTASVQITRQYSGDAPAQLRVTVMNRSGEPRDVTFGPTPPFSDYRGNHIERDAVAHIVPENRSHVNIVHPDDKNDEDEDPAEPIDNCWQIVGVQRDDLAQLETLDPCESLSETYSIFASADNNDCLPAGEYQFESHWYNDPGTDPEFSVDWSFRLSVEEAEA